MRSASICRFRAFLVLVCIVTSLATLRSVNAAGVLVGQVIGPDMSGQLIPLEWAKVTAYADGTPVQSVSPEFGGFYSISLPPGLYVVTAEHPGFITQSKVTLINDKRQTRLDFYMDRAPSITGSTFDFDLSSGGPITVLAGELGWTTIRVTLRSGLPQIVNLSLSGLPYWVSASLSPRVGNPSFSSICLIRASLAASFGSYNVTVTGVGGGLIRSGSFTLIISPRASSPDKP